MKKSRYKGTIRTVLYVLLAIMIYLLQSSVFSRIRIAGTAPLLFPAAVISASIFLGYADGGLYGILCGVLCDSALGRPAVAMTLLLTGAGLCFGALAEKLLHKNLISCVTCSLLCSLICAMLQGFGFVAYDGAALRQVLQAVLIETAYSAVFAVPFFYIYRAADIGAMR